VGPKLISGPVEDPTGGVAQTAMSRQESFPAYSGQKAEVLTVGSLGGGQPVLCRQLADFVLTHVTQREFQPVENVLRDSAERVSLILLPIGSLAQNQVPWRVAIVSYKARVMASDEGSRSQPSGKINHWLNPHASVALNAWVGSKPGPVTLQPRIYNTGAKLVTQIECEMWETHRMGHVASPSDSNVRAATSCSVGLAVPPKLERYAHCRFGARYVSRHRAVHTSAHRDKLAPRHLRKVERPRSLSKCPVEGINRKLNRMDLCGRYTAELFADSSDPHPRGSERILAVGKCCCRGTRGGQGSASIGVKPTPNQTVPVHFDPELDQVTTGSAASGTSARR
jgi:hypothetical protein